MQDDYGLSGSGAHQGGKAGDQECQEAAAEHRMRFLPCGGVKDKPEVRWYLRSEGPHDDGHRQMTETDAEPRRAPAEALAADNGGPDPSLDASAAFAGRYEQLHFELPLAEP